MLMGRQLKLNSRSSGQLSCKTNSSTPTVMRPCLLKNINEEPSKTENVNRTPEKIPPELRVVSLNLENEIFNTPHKKVIKSPRRMPLYCVHLKRVRQNTHRDETQFNDEFLVKGVEVRIDNDRDHGFSDSEQGRVCEVSDQDRDEYKFVEDGIQIQLTDCCQCVCDLFNSGFQISHDYHEFSFVPAENYGNETSARPQVIRETPRQTTESVLDPNILKVIRVTMNTKKSK